MPTVITNSPNIQTLDSKIVFDICLGVISVDITPSVFSSGGISGMKGGKVRIVGQTGVIKDYTSSYDLPAASAITSEFHIDMPSVNGRYAYGSYLVSVSVVDANNSIFEVTKKVLISTPDLKNPQKNYRALTATIKAVPTENKVSVTVASPTSYMGAQPLSYSYSVSLVYPEDSAQPDLIEGILSFDGMLFEGLYYVSGTACVLYDLTDNFFVNIPYIVNYNRDVLYKIDFKCVFQSLLEIDNKIADPCTLKCDKDSASLVAVQALLSLKSAELSSASSEDPTYFIKRLNTLLGLNRDGCTNRTII